jgi:hypothetical protein
MPETTDSTKPYIDYVLFLYIHIYDRMRTIWNSEKEKGEDIG